MIISKNALPRRTMLKGLGAVIALPLLEAMVPAMTPLANTPASPHRRQRLGYVYAPLRCDASRWTPPGDDLRELSPTLMPLAPVRQHVTAISNLELTNADPATQATAFTSFLYCGRIKRVDSPGYYAGTTIDQIAAQDIGQETRIPSLELSVDLPAQDDQSNDERTRQHSDHLSWSTTPSTSITSPRILFETLFGTGHGFAKRRTAINQQSSLLDSIGEEIKRLKKVLGPGDRTLVSQYLQSVRDVEQRIQQTESNTRDDTLPDLHRPTSVSTGFAEHVRLMFDLQLLALQGDVTRVITFQLDHEASGRTYPEIGVMDSHHWLIQHDHQPETLAKIAKINRFHVSLFSEFLQKMQSTPEGEGTLLDHSLYVYGGGLRANRTYRHEHLPILIAGGATTGVRGGAADIKQGT